MSQPCASQASGLRQDILGENYRGMKLSALDDLFTLTKMKKNQYVRYRAVCNDCSYTVEQSKPNRLIEHVEKCTKSDEYFVHLLNKQRGAKGDDINIYKYMYICYKARIDELLVDLIVLTVRLVIGESLVV